MKKNVLNLRLMMVALAIVFTSAAHAFTAVTSGNWSSAATWGGTAPGTNVNNADIIIPGGITVTLDTDVTFTGLLNLFNVGGTLSSTTNNNLTITQGALSGNGTISIRKISFTGLSTSTFAGSLTVNEMYNSTASLAFVAIANVSDSLILESGNLLLNTNSNLSLMTGSTIKMNNGGLNVNGGILNTANNYNVLYVGNSKTSGIELNSVSVQNISVKMNNNSEIVTLNANTTVNNNLNITTGIVRFNGRKLTLKGDIMMSAGTALSSNSSSELVIEGSGMLTSSLMFSPGSSLDNMTINRNTTVKLASAQNINGELALMNGTLSLESGSSLTMNAASKIHVEAGTMVVNSGNFTGTAAYNVEYMGSTNSNTGVELSGSGLNNVTVNYTSVNTKVVLTNSTSVNGKLDMMNGHIDFNGKNLSLNGTISQNGNSTFIGHPASELNLNLTSASSTTLHFDATSTLNQTLAKLKMNVSGTADVMLGTMLRIRNELNFVKGKLLLDNSDLVIEASGSITGFDDTRYIATSGTGNGRLQMNVTSGGSFVTFPVGTTQNYSPAYIQQTSSATTGNIMIKAMNDVLTGGTIGFPIGVLSAVSRTWFIEAESGVTVNMNMKLGWVAAAELNGFNRANAMIRHYTNNNWDTNTAAAATVGSYNTFELTRNGITSLSPFAVSDNNAALSLDENNNDIQFVMFPNPAKDVVTLTVPTSEAYSYEITDVTGRIVSTSLNTGNTAKLDVSALHTGVYFIKTTNVANNTTGVKRFIKD